MAQHINNVCNLSNIDGEKVKFITTDNFGVTQTLKNTGDIVLFRDNDRHDIYVSGEHIAGGYGFDDDSPIERLNDVAITYYNYLHYLNYIDENFETIQKVVDENKDEDEESSEEDSTIDIIDEPFVTLDNVSFTYSDTIQESIILETDNELIVKAGCDVKFNTISFTVSGNCNISYLDIYSKKRFEKFTNIYGKRYTNYVIDKTDYEVNPNIELNENNYLHTETDGSNVNELTLTHTGIQTETQTDYIDNVLIAIKNETQPQYPGDPQTFISKPIYWQLPYLFGTENITPENFNNYDGSFIYRRDLSVNTMIETEISIQFSNDYTRRSHGYFACPQQWGEPKFTHKDSGMTHYWEKLTTNPIQCSVNGVNINYNVYCTKHEYFNEAPITWIVSKE